MSPHPVLAFVASCGFAMVVVAPMLIDESIQLLRLRRARGPGMDTAAEADALMSGIGPVEPVVVELPRALPRPVSPLLHHLPVELASRVRPPHLYGAPRQPAPVEITCTRTETAPGSRVGTPILDAVVESRAARMRALTMPTAEMRIVFAEIAKRFDAADWVCLHCTPGSDHRACHGCTCTCQLELVGATHEGVNR